MNYIFNFKEGWRSQVWHDTLTVISEHGDEAKLAISYEFDRNEDFVQLLKGKLISTQNDFIPIEAEIEAAFFNSEMWKDVEL